MTVKKEEQTVKIEIGFQNILSGLKSNLRLNLRDVDTRYHFMQKASNHISQTLAD